MAENIDKLYPRGIWAKDTPEQRFEHILDKLAQRYSRSFFRDDDNDLRWHIKMAILNRIYVSQDVHDAYFPHKWRLNASNHNHTRFQQAFSNIVTFGYAEAEYVDLRKWCTHVNISCTPKVYFEHIIPSKVYLNQLTQRYLDDILSQVPFTLADFITINRDVNICIITKDEQAAIDKDYRSSMPSGWKWGDCPFARYISTGVNIYIPPALAVQGYNCKYCGICPKANNCNSVQNTYSPA